MKKTYKIYIIEYDNGTQVFYPASTDFETIEQAEQELLKVKEKKYCIAKFYTILPIYEFL